MFLKSRSDATDVELSPITFNRPQLTVECTVTIPIDGDSASHAMRWLLKGIARAFGDAGLETSELESKYDEFIEHVCSRPEMFRR